MSKNLENIHHDLFFLCAFQNNLNGKHKNIQGHGKKESSENRADTLRPLPPKVVRLPVYSLLRFWDVFW